MARRKLNFVYSKSSAAREYARQYGTRYPNAVVWTVNAETYSSFQRDLHETGIQGSGKIYPLPENNHGGLSTRSTARWLLVVENANDWDLLFGPGSILQYIPRSSNGSVLFITRDKYVARRLASTSNIEILDSLDKSEAEELLRSGIGKPNLASGDAASVDELLKRLRPCFATRECWHLSVFKYQYLNIRKISVSVIFIY